MFSRRQYHHLTTAVVVSVPRAEANVFLVAVAGGLTGLACPLPFGAPVRALLGILVFFTAAFGMLGRGNLDLIGSWKACLGILIAGIVFAPPELWLQQTSVTVKGARFAFMLGSSAAYLILLYRSFCLQGSIIGERAFLSWDIARMRRAVLRHNLLNYAVLSGREDRSTVFSIAGERGLRQLVALHLAAAEEKALIDAALLIPFKARMQVLCALVEGKHAVPAAILLERDHNLKQLLLDTVACSEPPAAVTAAVAEVYCSAGKAAELVAELSDRSAGAAAFARIIEQRFNAGDRSAAIAVYRQRPVPMRNLAETWREGLCALIAAEGPAEVAALLTRIPRQSWDEEEYRLWIEAAITGERSALLLEGVSFLSIDTRSNGRKILALYYDAAVRLENAGRRGEAAVIYGRIIDDHIHYKDVFERLLRIYSASSEGLPDRLPKAVYYGGKYELSREIGSGPNGTVYEARDRQRDRTVVIKRLRSELTADPALMKRFIDEAKRAARLRHPSIASLYDLFEEQGSLFYVYEQVPGENLAVRLKRDGRLPLQEVKRIVQQVCGALAYAHEKEILHCNLKPANFIETPDGRIKITDFGMSPVTAARDTPQDAIAAYTAPELVLGVSDTGSDIYALGTALYEMLTGKTPVKDGHGRPAGGEVLPDLSRAIEEIIGRCLKAGSAERYPNAEELQGVFLRL